MQHMQVFCLIHKLDLVHESKREEAPGRWVVANIKQLNY